MKDIISRWIVPVDGWYFSQGRHLIRGSHYGELIQNVTLHRKNNGIPVMDVDMDVQNQIASRCPFLKLNRVEA